jgi:hypothetical protein
MKVVEQINLGSQPESLYDRELQGVLKRVLEPIAIKLNQLGEGRLAAKDNLRTAAPTTGTWQQGDEVNHSAPVEAGSPGSRYVIQGWICVASGTPGTWVQKRYLTGN